LLRRIVGRVRCLFGKHERWKRYAKLASDGNYVTRCRHCGVPMRQTGVREWIVDNAPR
jgi:hypothetical protein